MSRLLTVTLLCASLPAAASAQGVSGRFSNQVATVGAPLKVQVEVEDPVNAVARVQVELRRPEMMTWTATTATPGGTVGGARVWAATFPVETLWPAGAPAAETLELRALMYGRRGGLLMVIGEIEPFEMDVLSPTRAAARERALSRPTASTAEPATGADTVSIAGYVGAEGRLGSSARARGFIGAGGPIADTLELRGVVVVGPTFSVPDDLSGGGPVALGFELDLRAYLTPLSESVWNLFAEPFITADLRLPGFDAGGGGRVGGLYWVSEEVAVEASFGGALMIFGAVPASGESRKLGFSGGLRIGVRFGPERG